MSPSPSLCQQVEATKVLARRVLDLTGTLPDYSAALALGHAGKCLAEGRCVVFRQSAAGLVLEICRPRKPYPTEVPPS
jgi:hypothetical protein